MGDFFEWLIMIGLAVLVGGVIGAVLATLIEATPRSHFVSQLRRLRSLLLSIDHPDHDFIADQLSDERLEPLADAVAERLGETLVDKKSRTIVVASDQLCVIVMGLVASTPDAAMRWFGRKWQGYLPMLEHYLEDPEVRDKDAEVLCHVALGAQPDTWANMSLLPLRGDRFRSAPVLALDLMTAEEQRRLTQGDSSLPIDVDDLQVLRMSGAHGPSLEASSDPSESEGSALELAVRSMSPEVLRSLHGRALDRLRSELERAPSPDAWSSLATTWLDRMANYIAKLERPPLEQGSPPEWGYVTDMTQPTERDRLDHAAQLAVLRFEGEWTIQGLGVEEPPDEDGRTGPQRVERALLELIEAFIRRIGGDVVGTLQAHARDVVDAIEADTPGSVESVESVESVSGAGESDGAPETLNDDFQLKNLFLLSDEALIGCEIAALDRLLSTLAAHGDDDWSAFMIDLLEAMKTWLETRAETGSGVPAFSLAKPPEFPQFPMDGGQSLTIRTASEAMIAVFNLARGYPDASREETIEQLYLKTMALFPFVELEYGESDSTHMKMFADDLDAAVIREGIRPTMPVAAPPDFAVLFVDRMREHRERMLAAGHPDRDLIAQLFADDALEELGQLAAAKMQQSFDDGVPHSIMLADERAATVVMTFRGSVADAADWFGREWGGYTRMLDGYLANDQVRGSGPECLGHVSYGYDGESAWVNATLLAVEGPAFRDVPILATDLMSEEEIAAAGTLRQGT